MLRTRLAMRSGHKAITQTISSCHKAQTARVVTARFKSEYLHESIVPTDHFQKSLPRLPIPELEKTCERYLATQRAYLNDDAFNKTKSYTDTFKSEVGKDLNEKLLNFDRENKHTSYITGFWFDMYLKDRRPVVLNHNPFMSFNPPTNPSLKEPLVRATNMIISSLKYCKTLRANILEPEIFHLNPKNSDTLQFRKFVRMLPKSISFYGAYWYKAFPLDMSQFPSLFNSSRIPVKGKDKLYKNEKAKHMLVMRNGNMYIFDCFDRDGNILPASQIMSNIKYIMEDRSERPSHPLGYLTSQNRDVWAQARDNLLASGNTEQLDLIDSALFNLSLDDHHADNTIDLSKQFLYGDGGSRWFDKSVSLLMTSEGEASVNFEHSWGDGVAVMSYFNAIHADGNDNPAVDSPNVATAEPQVTKLEFKLNDTNKADIDLARKQYEDATGKLRLNFLEYSGLGKSSFKTLKISPDSMMQLSFQMAYRKVFGHTPATYESSSTSAFKHGRTETVRPATAATNQACELFSLKACKEELLAALKECSNVHGELTKNGAMGQGWDRHLYALRHFAEADGLDIPLFSDESYKAINTITLSTSTLSSPAVQSGGFAPVVPHGLGVGYGIRDTELGAVVTSYEPHTPDDFIAALRESVTEIKNIVS